MKIGTVLTLIIVITFGICDQANAQEAIFSQYELAPLYLNPALTGDFNGRVRVAGIFTNQLRQFYSNSWTTGGLSADVNIPLGGMTSFGFGCLVYSNGAGSNKRHRYNLSSSLAHYITKNTDSYNLISIGLNIGTVYSKSRFIRTISDSTIPFPNPFDEFNHQYQISYMNIGSGVLWKQKMNSRLFYHVGFSAYYLNRPNVSHYTTIDNILSVRLYFHGMLEFPLGKNISIVPNFVFSKQGDSNLNLLRLSSKFFYKESQLDKWIQIGLHTKAENFPYYQDSEFYTFGIASIMKLKVFLIGFSYDRSIDWERNTFEVSFGYQFGNNSNEIADLPHVYN